MPETTGHTTLSDHIASTPLAVIGYGAQGRAQALNLRDAGLNVIVGLRPGSESRTIAESDDLKVLDIGPAVAAAEVVICLVADDVTADVFAADIRPNLRPGAYLGFGHGYAVRFGNLDLPDNLDVFLCAPRGPGRLIRQHYLDQTGFVCSIAVAQDPDGDTRDVARAYACAIGAIPHAIFDTTFQEECESDLFGEQAVLCGGLVELIRSAYVTLVEAGFDPQMAYFECVHEAKLITDLLFERGIAGMRAGTSRAAQFGGLTRGPRVIGPEARDAMKQILAEIQSGQFAAEYQADTQAGSPKLKQLAAAEAAHPIEKVSRQLREVIHTSRKNSQDG